MTHAEKARDLFLSGCSCSQAVLGAYCEELGIPMETALRIASSFGGGIGGSRELCGAVSGMLMAAGLKWGYTDVHDLDVKKAYYARTRTLLDAFKAEHGTTCCRELLASLSEIKTEPSARTAQYYKERPCARYVETAARLIEEMDERTDAAP